MTDEHSTDSEFSPAVAVADSESNGTGQHPETPADGIPEAASSTEAGGDAGDEAPDFLTQLARAMQATAGAERSRVVDEIERRRAAHVALLEARRDAEVARMRELADDDRKSIDRWADTERQRIQAERERRTSELQTDLARSLDEHGQQVDGQIRAAESAVAAHRTEVDAFFAALEGETDPVRIAQQAGRRPAFPDLEAASAATTPTDDAAASPGPSPTTEPEAIGVMDPSARRGLLASARRPTVEPGPTLEASPAAPDPEASAETGPSVLTPVAARTSGRPEETHEPAADSSAEPPAEHASSGLNPMGWLRRGNDDR